MKNIPYGRQYIDADDIKAVVKVLKSDFITQGPAVGAFEKKLASYCKVKYVVAVSSGTAALHLACLAADLPRHSEVITTPVTFLATANSILYAGLKPVFADIEPDTFNIDPEKISGRISSRTRAIIPVHFAGLPCDMPGIRNISRGKDIIIIEDACHALGAEYTVKGRKHRVGSCAHSDMAVFSFHPVKHITTGEGGAITTNNRKYYERLLRLRSHGVVKPYKKCKEIGPWYYEMRALGFNYRMTDIQAALGGSQMAKLTGFVKKRREIARLYKKFFYGMEEISLQEEPPWAKSAYHLFVLNIDFKVAGIGRKSVMNELADKGIGTQVHYIPIYKQPYYKKILPGNMLLDNTEDYYRKALSIPIFPSIKHSEVSRIAREVKRLAGR
ncbi:MAG: UDP-4-amino-4,6-dideoxy-N-acetyl-beta-L-altrosamine transaminase [Candidatus Aureabacteria bacterium]|nr:UDP-4-amino-4,6-dideoxy-N-acetyl-beta-L-altrosamine transaminase [Candidatus Auribacterota bacterium]